MSSVLDQWVRQQYPMVLSFCTSLVGRRAEAEDLAQEVFLVAWRKRGELRPSLPPGPWLRGIARNLARNARRRAQPVAFVGDAALEWLEGVYRRIEAPPGEQWADRLDALEACLAELDEADRLHLSLRYDGGCSYDEISARLKTSLESVKKRLYRARRRLADCVLGKLEVADG
ncbi:MAG: sigma-70 family RNA polymerase sigma factor [Planctomycetes bacterium]|nr:sigma-70 family RNA polymerase sigma factor [Planctomycetota bacterium]